MTRRLIDLRQQIAEPLDPPPVLPSAVRVEAPIDPHVRAVLRRLSVPEHQRLIAVAMLDHTTVEAVIERRLDYLKGLLVAGRS